MGTKVKLSDIIEALEFQNADTEYYLDTNTGTVYLLSTEELLADDEDDPLDDYPEWQRPTIEIARRLAHGDDENLIELPTQWDVNEYEMMEAFCDTQPAGADRDSLRAAIKGKGAFRRFKDTARSLDLLDQWHQFRQAEFKAIAIDWCQANEIPYADDTKS